MKITHDSLGKPLEPGNLIWCARGFYSKQGYHIIRELTAKSIRTIFLICDLTKDPAVALKHIKQTGTLFKLNIDEILTGCDNQLKTILGLELAKWRAGVYNGLKEVRAPRQPRLPRARMRINDHQTAANPWPTLAADLIPAAHLRDELILPPQMVNAIL